MKTIIFLLLLLYSVNTNAQHAVHITPQQLFTDIEKMHGGATVIQFWNPNCAEVAEIVKEYQAVVKSHPEVNFYFIAITSKDELVNNAINANGYTNDLYVADALVNADLYERRQTFCKQLCKLLNLKEAEFLTLCLDKNDKVTYIGDSGYSDISNIIPVK